MHNLTGRVNTLNFISPSFIQTLLYHFAGLTSEKVWRDKREKAPLLSQKVRMH